MRAAPPSGAARSSERPPLARLSPAGPRSVQHVHLSQERARDGYPTAAASVCGRSSACRTTGPERAFSFRVFGPAPEGGLVPPPSEGPSGATVGAAGGSPQIRQGGRSAAQSARTRAGLRKRRPRSPRSPALGRTHNDGAPVLKLGQGLFSEIATFTLESGPTTLVPARFVAAVSRDGAP